MSEKFEFTGTDVSQAIADACEKMQVSQGQLNIEVLAAGSTGIFGIIGKKKAKIVVSLKKKKGKGSSPRPPRKGAKDSRPHKDNRPRKGGRRRSPAGNNRPP
ncbi:MAG: Jag N-terminal domain-containing protein, partial [Thermodesulfobacteriota bacterium]